MDVYEHYPESFDWLRKDVIEGYPSVLEYYDIFRYFGFDPFIALYSLTTSLYILILRIMPRNAKSGDRASY